MGYYIITVHHTHRAPLTALTSWISKAENPGKRARSLNCAFRLAAAELDVS